MAKKRRKDKEDRKENWLQIRVSDSEKAIIEKRAKMEHLDLSGFARKTLLDYCESD